MVHCDKYDTVPELLKNHEIEMDTVYVEIFAVCKFRGFRCHFLVQRKFNPQKFVS